MEIENSRFLVHDVAAFPLVWSRGAAIRPGYAAQWQAEMDALLVAARPFVIIMEQGSGEEQEEHEDRKLRGLWLKRNKATLGQVCKAVIGIEPDTLRRAGAKAQSLLVGKAFGVTMEVAASRQEAEAIAWSALNRN